jgi:hypothetical protein
MKTTRALAVVLWLVCLVGCTPRDFLTRRLAANLIAAADDFRAPQVFWLRTGTISNRDYNEPDSLVLQRRGWIIGTQIGCPSGVEPPPCWDVALSPLGVDAFRPLLRTADSSSTVTDVRVARRELLAVTGISKDGNFADVEFLWHWVPMNDVGSALYDSGVRYRSIVAFRRFDDGWRLLTEPIRSNQPLDDALHNAEPKP